MPCGGAARGATLERGASRILFCVTGTEGTGLLPHLARVARQARKDAGVPRAPICARVVHHRTGRVGVADSTLARFEYAHHWPEDPDAVMVAYAEELGIDVCLLWDRAVQLASAARRRSGDREHAQEQQHENDEDDRVDE